MYNIGCFHSILIILFNFKLQIFSFLKRKEKLKNKDENNVGNASLKLIQMRKQKI